MMLKLFVFILLIVSCSSFMKSFSRSSNNRLRMAFDDEDLPLRIGHGFDIHRLIEGPKLVIGGVTIPHTKGAEAHSDGDAMYHSIVDAILGALTLPDIGQLFPDNDKQWKGADSSIFMEEAYKKVYNHLQHSFNYNNKDY